jgi:hypothetical protein
MGKTDVRLSYLEQNVQELIVFKNKGDRFTNEDGVRLENKIDTLASQVGAFPPQWFRDDFRELRETVVDLKKVVRKLGDSVLMLEKQDVPRDHGVTN